MNTVERTRTEGGLIYNVEETISTQGQCIGKSMDQSTMWIRGRDRVDHCTLYTVEETGWTKVQCREVRLYQSILQRIEGVPKFIHCPKINGNFA